MTILLSEIWPIDDLENYKIHFARWNKHSQPLEVFARDRAEWRAWQEYRPQRNEFNRPFIFALVQFYHEDDVWLFGGVFKVLDRQADRYAVELTNIGHNLIGRLKIYYRYRSRGTRTNMAPHYRKFIVQEILREPYCGRSFPGLDNINLSFEELRNLVQRQLVDWRGPMENTKGVYLITDTNSGRRYVGAAYGDQGVWSRWAQYVENGHGGNIQLQHLVAKNGLAYCQEHFQFSLLEQCAFRTPDDVILQRETYWKDILLTRGKFGLNGN